MRTPEDRPILLWEPDGIADTAIGRDIAWLHQHGHIDTPTPDYQRLWEWSVADPDRFWASIWQFFDVRADGDPTLVLADRAMPGARWFPHTRLNYAEHALPADRPGDATALVAYDESQHEPTRLSYGQLRDQVARARAGLRAVGGAPVIASPRTFPTSRRR
ncbi:acetyl-coenzyme A synthetase N-terminal domain-containing protein [Streptomyces sp. NPDC059627]